ncbi:hypothetical protein [Dactylosporangium sp. NPDC051541]|uniref:hypothetical protein n=1 Tax=Dactylosporangium sp. NPDC051541 TaxID=3363977 RepID=UPI003790B44C
MERDLRTLLTSVRDDAPPPRLSVDDITAAGRHLVRRRRRNALLSSAGGGVVTAIAAVTAAFMFAGGPAALGPAVDPSSLPSAASPAPTAFAAAPPFTTTYKGYQTPSYQVSDPDVVTVAYQESAISGSGLFLDPSPAQTAAQPSVTNRTGAPGATPSRIADLTPGGSLVVYRPDAFDPAVFEKGGDKLQLPHGQVALLAYAGSGSTSPSGPPLAGKGAMDHGEMVPTLAWQYMDGAWAAIYWSSWEDVPPLDDLIAIADGLSPAAPRPFPVAFQTASPVRGYQLVAVSNGRDLLDEGEIVSAVRLSPTPARLPIIEPYDFDNIGVLTLAVGRGDGNSKLAGRLECEPDRQHCTKFLDSGSAYTVASTVGLKNPSGAQLTQITLSIKPQNLDNAESWPPATKVFE